MVFALRWMVRELLDLVERAAERKSCTHLEGYELDTAVEAYRLTKPR
jgi:hypothetical protein